MQCRACTPMYTKYLCTYFQAQNAVRMRQERMRGLQQRSASTIQQLRAGGSGTQHLSPHVHALKDKFACAAARPGPLWPLSSCQPCW